MTTIKVGSQDAEGFHPDGSIVDPAAVEEFINNSPGLNNKLGAKANAASLAAKLDKTEAATTYAQVMHSRSTAHRLVSLGDSITIGGDSNNSTAPTRLDTYASVLSLLSDGRIQFVRNAGVGGNQGNQMLARFDTDVTPYAPTMVSIMFGTNDVTFGTSDATYKQRIKDLVAKIRSINALPVILCSPPVNSIATADKQRLTRWHTWLGRYGAANGIPVIDTFGVLVDPATIGNYQAALTSDGGTHPSSAGHFLMGQEAYRVLGTNLPPVARLVSRSNLDPNNKIINGMFLTDTNADGLADNFTVSISPTAGTGTASITTDAGYPGGKAQRLTLAAATGEHRIIQTASGFAPGDVIRVSCIMSKSSVDVAAYMNLAFPSLLSWTNQYTAGTYDKKQWVYEAVAPAGASSIELRLGAKANAAGASGYVEFGAVTVYNMTTQSIVDI